MTGLLADVHNQGARRQELASQEVMEGFNPHPGALPIVYLQGILCQSSELSGPMYRKSTSEHSKEKQCLKNQPASTRVYNSHVETHLCDV